MSTVIEAPREMVEAVANLRLPSKTDQRLQRLADRQADGSGGSAKARWGAIWPSVQARGGLQDGLSRVAPGFRHDLDRLIPPARAKNAMAPMRMLRSRRAGQRGC